MHAAGGCESLRWSFSPGLAGVRGARYLLTIGFARASGLLLPPGQTPRNTSSQQTPGSAAGGDVNATSTGTVVAGGGIGIGPELTSAEAILSIEPVR